MKTIRHFDDLWFTVVAAPDTHEVGYCIFKIESQGLQPAERTYCRSGLYSDETSDLADAQVFAYGRVKWDGCSDWYFDEQEKMIHGCSRQELIQIGEVLAACWDWTKDLIPEHWSA